MIKAIFLDAGHGLGPTGAVDNGAAGNGTNERKEVVEMAQELVGLLQGDPAFAGIAVIPVAVAERLRLVDHIKAINDRCRASGWGKNDALMLSLHVNSAGTPAARGLEAWYSPSEEGMLQFARLLVEQVSLATGIPPRAKPALVTAENRFGRLGIIDDTVPNGCLFEAGFITNEFDAAYLKDTALGSKIVAGLLAALRIQLGLSAPVPTEPPAFFFDVPADAWYHDDVALCFREGLFRMPQDGLFRPDRPVTRAEVAAVLARHLRSHHSLS